MPEFTDDELAKIRAAIGKSKAARVLVQAPEGFRTKIQNILDEIAALGVEAVFYAEPCFGACDIPYHTAKDLDCQLIVHIGHADFGVKSEVPVVYVEKFSDADPTPILEREFFKVDGAHKSFGLVSLIQNVKALPKVKSWLEDRGKKAFIGVPPAAKIVKLAQPGQILGCNVGTGKMLESKVDAYLYVGGGRFHPYGLLKNTSKPVFWVDMESGKIFDVTKERENLQKRKLARIGQFRAARNVALAISTKAGQMAFAKSAFDLKKRMEKNGKKVWLLTMDMITPDKLTGLKIEALVNAACPRIEDDLIFSVPIINAADAARELKKE